MDLHSISLFNVTIYHFTESQCLTVSCDSWQYQKKNCDVSGMTADSLISSVTVLEQKSPSESQCVENKSFGVDTLNIWVDKGCRADFTVCYIPGNT